jgi:hypothetical protein
MHPVNTGIRQVPVPRNLLDGRKNCFALLSCLYNTIQYQSTTNIFQQLFSRTLGCSLFYCIIENICILYMAALGF